MEGGLRETNVSMKFTPTYSFLTNTSPSFGTGTGKSVLNWRTSVPPVFSMIMPSIVFGRVVVDIVRAAVAGECGFPSWEVRAVRRFVVVKRAR